MAFAVLTSEAAFSQSRLTHVPIELVERNLGNFKRTSVTVPGRIA
jgi:hypothetical protein